jgi:hypothetical protein
VNIVILNWQRPLWKGYQEVVKKSGRDEPMWVVIHMCMEATLGISFYRYLYPKLAKMLCPQSGLFREKVVFNWDLLNSMYKKYCIVASLFKKTYFEFQNISNTREKLQFLIFK